jgi:hypothetical protein
MVPLLMVSVPVWSFDEVEAAAVSCSEAFPAPLAGDTENPFPETEAVQDMLLVDRLMACIPPSCGKVTVVGLASMKGISGLQPATNISAVVASSSDTIFFIVERRKFCLIGCFMPIKK